MCVCPGQGKTKGRKLVEKEWRRSQLRTLWKRRSSMRRRRRKEKRKQQEVEEKMEDQSEQEQ